ncbi:M60 family peptidase N-terminal accessory domain-containing protein, partial [Bacillus mycoides]
MKRKKQKKSQNLLVVTATLSMFATGVTPSLEVFAEEQTQKQEASTVLKNEQAVKVEDRSFMVAGKGDIVEFRNREKRDREFSPFEPTGLYAKPNEKITIQVAGNQNIEAYIGTYSYDASWREDSKVKSFTLKPGSNTIESPNGGMIYFYNKQKGGTIQTTVTTGGTATPLFELGKHTKQDLIDMLNQYPNAHAVELKGERVLITASPARVKKYLLGSNTD